MNTHAQIAPNADDVVLTGDRPTGPLHLGHYAGSLMTRLVTQERVARQVLLIADMQALTDNADDPGKVARNVVEVALDYLAVGLEPPRSLFVLQSAVPELCELTMLYLNVVTVSRLERNPTTRAEIALRGFVRDIPAGFLCYPVAQAADITGFDATLVPVGEDQLPMLELCTEIEQLVNRAAGAPVLRSARAMLSSTPRLPGVDGRKASKSLGNAIALGASNDEIRARVRSMFTDPDHLRVEDPGKIEGNVVFAYLHAFDPDRDALATLTERYQRGGVGDMTVKHRLEDVLVALLEPIRARRDHFEADRGEVMRLVAASTEQARATVADVNRRVRAVFGLAV